MTVTHARRLKPESEKFYREKDKYTPLECVEYHSLALLDQLPVHCTVHADLSELCTNQTKIESSSVKYWNAEFGIEIRLGEVELEARVKWEVEVRSHLHTACRRKLMEMLISREIRNSK